MHFASAVYYQNNVIEIPLLMTSYSKIALKGSNNPRLKKQRLYNSEKNRQDIFINAIAAAITH